MVYSVFFLLDVLLLSFFFLIPNVNGETLNDFLFKSKRPASISMSVSIAALEADRIRSLTGQVNGVVLFLPDNASWSAQKVAYDNLLREKEGNVRSDAVLAVSAEVPLAEAFSVDSLHSFAKANGGVIDSTYGTSYFIKGGGSREICIAEWQKNEYVEGECASIVGNPIQLEDAVVYQVDKLLWTEALEEEIKGLSLLTGEL